VRGAVQVKRTMRDFFGCDSMIGAPLENYRAGRGIHWDQRILERELMDSQTSPVRGFGAAHVLTDVTLALLQDSGWCGFIVIAGHA
jgi:Leishmanolysin